MQGKITAANSLFKQRAILVVRRKDQAMFLKSFPVSRGSHCHRHAIGRNGGIGQIESVFQPRNPAILDAEGFQRPATTERRLSDVFTEMNSIIACEHSQVRERGQIMHPVITQYARIG